MNSNRSTADRSRFCLSPGSSPVRHWLIALLLAGFALGATKGFAENLTYLITASNAQYRLEAKIVVTESAPTLDRFLIDPQMRNALFAGSYGVGGSFKVTSVSSGAVVDQRDISPNVGDIIATFSGPVGSLDGYNLNFGGFNGVEKGFSLSLSWGGLTDPIARGALPRHFPGAPGYLFFYSYSAVSTQDYGSFEVIQPVVVLSQTELELQARIAALEAQVQSLQSQLPTASQAIALLNQENATLNQQVLALQNQLNTANTQLASFQQQLTAANTTIAQRDATIATQTTTIAQLNADKTALQAQLTAASTQLSSLQATLAAREATITDLRTQLTAATSRIATLQADVASRDAKITDLQSQLAAANTTIASRDATITGLRTDLGASSATIAARNATITGLQVNLTAATASLARLEAAFRRTFTNTAFAVPGASLNAQIDALIDGILAANRGSQQQVYFQLTNKKSPAHEQETDR